MSRKRVPVGTDARGRPIMGWTEPEAVDAPRYGHMEPAYDASSIERRIATPEELEARGANVKPELPTPRRTAPLGHGVLSAAARMQQSRQNGARRHVEVMAARHQEEEPTVAITEGAEIHPPTVNLFGALAEAAARAAEALERKTAADEAWKIARGAVDVAYADVVASQTASEPVEAVSWWMPAPEGPVVDDPVSPAEVRHEQLLEDGPRAVAAVTPVPEPAPAAGGGPGLPRQQQRILDATISFDGDRHLVAEEVGVSVANVNAVLHAIGAKGRLPIALIPKLPAGFARYQGV